MLILFAGLIGTGKTTLSKGVAEKLGFYRYDIDEVKKKIYPEDPDFEYNMKNGIPFSDETRIKVFEKATEDLKKLSGIHKNIIVDETFHKKNTREILFKIADKYSEGYVLIEVTSPEDVVKERLLKKERKGHILSDPYKMYLSFKQAFEPFTEEHIVYENKEAIDGGVKYLSDIILSKINNK